MDWACNHESAIMEIPFTNFGMALVQSSSGLCLTVWTKLNL